MRERTISNGQRGYRARTSGDETVCVLHPGSGDVPRYREALALHHRVRFFRSGRAYRAFVDANAPPSLTIASLRPRGESILDLLRSGNYAWLRSSPLIVVSWIDDVDLIRECYERGVTEYVSAPFRSGELRVKVQRALGQQERLAYLGQMPSSLELDARSLTLRLGSQSSAELTAKEFQIVAVLLSAPNRVVTRSEIRRLVWRHDRVGPKTLDVHLSKVRRKLSRLGLPVQHAGPGRVVLGNGLQQLSS